MKLLIGLLLLSVATLANSATVKEMNYTNDDGCYLQLEGKINDNDGVILNLYRNTECDALFLHSPGGSSVAMYKLMDVVKEMGIRTVVGDGMVCHSACANIWLASPNPTFHRGGEIGFHVGSYSADTLRKGQQDYGNIGMQTAIQEAFKESMAIYLNQLVYDLHHPYEFAYLISQEGWNSGLFYKPGIVALNRHVVNVLIYGDV